jgi:Co/Zn/Cd efflux system component
MLRRSDESAGPVRSSRASEAFCDFKCAGISVRLRSHSGSLTRAVFLSARNDVAASLAIIAASFVTPYTQSIRPNLVIGLAIAPVNVGAAREV